MLVEIHGQKRKSLCLGLLPIFLSLSPLFSLHYIQPLNKKPASFQCHWWALTKNKRIPISFISTLHQPVDLLQKHWNRYYIPMAYIWNTKLYAAEQCVFVKHRLSFFMQFWLRSISYMYQKWWFFRVVQNPCRTEIGWIH